MRTLLLALVAAVGLSAQPYAPETNSAFRCKWVPLEDSVVLVQRCALEIATPAGKAAPELPHSAVVSIVEDSATITVTLRKGPYVVSEPKPAPPKPTPNDFVPEYKVILGRLQNGDFTAFTAYADLVGRILSAGLTVPQVAQAAGAGGGK